MEKWSERLVDYLVLNGTVRDDERQLYVYGFDQGALMLLNIGTTLVIGFIMGMVWQSVVFMIAYIPLRSYAGGFHAKTPFRCYLVSVGIVFGVLAAVRYFPRNLFLWLSVTVVSAAVILILAPTEHKNKPLREAEKKLFRFKSRVILFILTTVALIAWPIMWKLSVCVSVSLTLMGVMLIAGRRHQYE